MPSIFKGIYYLAIIPDLVSFAEIYVVLVHLVLFVGMSTYPKFHVRVCDVVRILLIYFTWLRVLPVF